MDTYSKLNEKEKAWCESDNVQAEDINAVEELQTLVDYSRPLYKVPSAEWSDLLQRIVPECFEEEEENGI